MLMVIVRMTEIVKMMEILKVLIQELTVILMALSDPHQS